MCAEYVSCIICNYVHSTGVPCTDVTLVSSYNTSSVIQCTTGPQPQPTAYYPGKHDILSIKTSSHFLLLVQVGVAGRERCGLMVDAL